MKHARSFSVLLAALIVGILSQIVPARADNPNLDFTLVNKTGYGIKEVYIAPSASTDWGGNIITKPMGNGDVLPITFSPKALAEHWDIRIVWIDEGADVVWKKCKLTEISKFTLYYNRDTDETSADME
jgi:hypothetical protein